MRIRTIKPEFFLNDELAELSAYHRLVFIGLWCASDREGRFRWKAKPLKAQILPFEDVNFGKILADLWDAGYIAKYESDGREYGLVLGFKDHQVVPTREAKSRLPEPTALQLQCNYNAVTGNYHGGREGKGKEGNKEGKGKEEEGESEGKPKNGEVGASTSRVSRFVKPSMDEWKAYCATLSEKWKGKDVESAYDHYEANGWIRGKTKVKDWRACARTCFRNWQERNPNHTPTEYLTKNENGELEW